MTLFHQIENSLATTVSFHIEKSFKMTLFHQIGKHFRNDRAPQYLEMPVLHQIEKNLEMTALQN